MKVIGIELAARSVAKLDARRRRLAVFAVADVVIGFASGAAHLQVEDQLAAVAAHRDLRSQRRAERHWHRPGSRHVEQERGRVSLGPEVPGAIPALCELVLAAEEAVLARRQPGLPS